jgi:hypothetical protein
MNQAPADDPTETESDWHSTSFQGLASPYALEHKPVSVHSDLITINRFVKDRDQPWHPRTIAPPLAAATAPYYNHVSADFYSPRPGPVSELGSTGYCQSDSAYFTAPVAASIKSGSYFSPNLSNLDVPLADLDMSSIPESQHSNASDDEQGLAELAPPAISNRKARPPRGGKRTCEKCQKELKCPSDYK